jgi:8-oxo-dGTP pyrophosphatase MutT (NUDIX family)
MSSERRGARRDRRTLTEHSFGGVVVRGDEVAAIVPRGKRALALPKGGPESGERPEDTAAREVREETGLIARVRAPLGDVVYHYRRSGRRIRKTVSFFLLDYVEGSTDDHDHEVTEARWVPLQQARVELTYPGEREMVENAIKLLDSDQ